MNFGWVTILGVGFRLLWIILIALKDCSSALAQGLMGEGAEEHRGDNRPLGLASAPGSGKGDSTEDKGVSHQSQCEDLGRSRS